MEAKTFQQCHASTTDHYVVPPENTTRVVLSVTRHNTYVSIEDIDGTDHQWTHRENSAKGFGGSSGEALHYAERLWQRLQADDAGTVLSP